jgi:hypothetical protein
VEGILHVGFLEGRWEICKSGDDDGQGERENAAELRGRHELHGIHLPVAPGVRLCASLQGKQPSLSLEKQVFSTLRPLLCHLLEYHIRRIHA